MDKTRFPATKILALASLIGFGAAIHSPSFTAFPEEKFPTERVPNEAIKRRMERRRKLIEKEDASRV